MHQMNPFLGISLTIIIHFKLLNIVNLVLKLANILQLCDMVTVGLMVSEKTPGQTDKKTYKQTNKQTDQHRRKDYSHRATITNRQTNQQRQSPHSRCATITREPLSKGDSRTGLIAFHIQLPKM